MNRVVSLLPGSTEIICALGCGERLVGRSHECDYPPGVGDLPACTAPKFDPDGTSYQIDQRVKAILQEAVSVYRVDAGLLDRLEPDWLVTQSQCEVCAVSLEEVEKAACQLVRSRPATTLSRARALTAKQSVSPDSGRHVWSIGGLRICSGTAMRKAIGVPLKYTAPPSSSSSRARDSP